MVSSTSISGGKGRITIWCSLQLAISNKQYHLLCSSDDQLRCEFKGRAVSSVERHGFSWLNLLTLQVSALPRTSQHLRGEEKKRFALNVQILKPHSLAENLRRSTAA